MNRFFRSIRKAFHGICLVDKVLILYMVILLIYMGCHLFSCAAIQENNTVNIITRTSAAAIFGYFISNNFIKTAATKFQNVSAYNASNSSAAVSENPSNRIGFQTSAQAEKNELGKIDIQTDAHLESQCNRLQTIIVSAVGLLSLVFLLIASNFYQTTSEFSATVSQFRDFLSASIGFLVGCGKSK